MEDLKTGCKTSKHKEVKLKEVPDAGFSAADTEDPRPFAHCEAIPGKLTIINSSRTKSTNVKYFLNWGDDSPTQSFSADNFPAKLEHEYRKIGQSLIAFTVIGENGCQTTSSQAYFIGSKPGIGISRPNLPIAACAPHKVSLRLEGIEDNTPGTKYTVTFNDGSEPLVFYGNPPEEITHILTTPSCLINDPFSEDGTITAEVVAENPCGKSKAKIDLLHINAPPKPQIKVHYPEKQCPGSTYLFKDESISNYYLLGLGCSDKKSTTSWQISPREGYQVIDDRMDGKTMSVVFEKPGNYEVKLLTENPCGSAQVVKKITILEKPTVQFRVEGGISGEAVCIPTRVPFKNLSQHTTWSKWTITPNKGWAFSENSDQHTENPIVLFQKEGKYLIQLEAGNDCESETFTKNIEVFTLPKVQLSPIPDACEPFTINPKAIVLRGNPRDWKWFWQFPGGNSKVQSPGSINFVDSVNIISLTVENSCGKFTALDTLFIHPKEDVDAGPDLRLCSDSDCMQLKGFPAGGYWEGVGSPDGQLCPKELKAGQTYQGIYVLEQGSCHSRDTISIEIQEAPPLINAEDLKLCVNDEPVPLPTAYPNGTWEGKGISSKGVFDPGIAGTGKHLISYTIEDTRLGCNRSSSLQIEVKALPGLKLPDTLMICSTPEATDLSSQLRIPGKSNYALLWSGPGIIDPRKGIFDSQGKTGVYPLLLQYAYQDLPDCSKQVNLLVKVVSVPKIQMATDTSVCISDHKLQLAAYPATGKWQVAGPDAPAIDPITGIISLTKGGSFSYSYHLQNGAGCASKQSVAVEIFDFSQVDAGEDLHFCKTDSLITLSGYSPASGKWSGPGIIPDKKGVVNLGQLSIGRHALVYTLGAPSARCQGQDSLFITIHEPPTADFAVEGMECIMEPVRFQNRSVGGDAVFWNFGDHTTSKAPNPSHVFADTGSYKIVMEVVKHHPFDRSKSIGTARVQKHLLIARAPVLDDFEVNVNPNNKKNPIIILPGKNNLNEVTFDTVMEEIQDSKRSTKTVRVILTVQNKCGIDSRVMQISSKRCPTCKKGKRRKRKTRFSMWWERMKQRFKSKDPGNCP